MYRLYIRLYRLYSIWTEKCTKLTYSAYVTGVGVVSIEKERKKELTTKWKPELPLALKYFPKYFSNHEKNNVKNNFFLAKNK